jgi:hypothetical protein
MHSSKVCDSNSSSSFPSLTNLQSWLAKAGQLSSALKATRNFRLQRLRKSRCLAQLMLCRDFSTSSLSNSWRTGLQLQKDSTSTFLAILQSRSPWSRDGLRRHLARRCLSVLSRGVSSSCLLGRVDFSAWLPPKVSNSVVPRARQQMTTVCIRLPTAQSRSQRHVLSIFLVGIHRYRWCTEYTVAAYRIGP